MVLGQKKNVLFDFVFSELGTKKSNGCTAILSSGKKKTGFTVFSELGTKKTLVLLRFVVCSELGTKTKQWFYCVF